MQLQPPSDTGSTPPQPLGARMPRALWTGARNSLLMGSLACLLLALASCNQAPRPDILLVSLDTLRADHLSSYGYHRRTSPFFDQLAAQGLRFEAARAPASNTAPSHMSLFTGLDPVAHGVRPVDPVLLAKGERTLIALSSEVATLPEHLQRAGYTTLGLIDNGFVMPGMGFGRGWDYVKNRRTTLAEKLTQAGVRVREADADTPLFLFFHTYATHAPYLPPAEIHGTFANSQYQGVYRQRYEELVKLPLEEAWRKKATFLAPFEGSNATDLAFLEAIYDEGILHADWGLRRLWSLWSSLRDPENTLLIVLSDHGEGFLEHGNLGHQYGPYGELIDIPLFMRGPHIVAGVEATPVSLTDLLPTLLEHLNLPGAQGQGESFAPLLRTPSKQAAARPTFSQLDSKRGLVDAVALGDLRLIRRNRDGELSFELFDVSQDPEEAHDLQAERPEDLAKLKQLLEQRELLGRTLRRSKPPEGGGTLDPQEEIDLRALGYLTETGEQND